MATLLGQFLTELGQHKTSLEPKLEGAHDYSRLNLTAQAKEIADKGIADYQKRLDLVNTAIQALTALSDNTYPTLPRYNVRPAVGSDLKDNSDTILAFLGQVDVEAEVVGGTMEFHDV